MQIEEPSKVVAPAMGLAAFAVAVLAGLSARNEAWTVLLNAVGCMVVAQLVGLVIGAIGQHVAREQAALSRGAPGAGAEGGSGARAAPAAGG